MMYVWGPSRLETYGSVVNCMIMVPKRSCILTVWVVIVFVLSWFGSIIGPTVKWSTSYAYHISGL